MIRVRLQLDTFFWDSQYVTEVFHNTYYTKMPKKNYAYTIYYANIVSFNTFFNRSLCLKRTEKDFFTTQLLSKSTKWSQNRCPPWSRWYSADVNAIQYQCYAYLFIPPLPHTCIMSLRWARAFAHFYHCIRAINKRAFI